MKSVKLSFFAPLFFFSCSLFSQSLFAQADQDTLPFKHIEVGPYFSAGLSIFQGDVPSGAKTDIHFAYGAGALVSYAFHQNWGLALGLGYDSRGMYFHQQGNTHPDEDLTLNYFSIQPSLKFKQFLLGVNIGLPMSGRMKVNSADNIPVTYSTETDVNSNDLNTSIDIRASGLLPLVENDNGALYFMINACYNVSDAFNKSFSLFFQDPGTSPISKSPIPTVQIGLSYLFAPGGKTR